MARTHLIISGFVILLIFSACTDGADTVVHWTELGEATAAASDERGLMYFFTSEDCGFCRKVKEENFRDEETVDFLNDNFVCVNLVSGEDGVLEQMEYYRVTAFPTFLFLDPARNEKARITGYLNIDDFNSRIDEIRNDVNTLDFYLQRSVEEGGEKYLLDLFRIYAERKDPERLVAAAHRMQLEAPELYAMKEEYVHAVTADVMFDTQQYDDFITESGELLSLRIERHIRTEYLKIATAYTRLGRYTEASEVYQLLIKLLPSDITAYTDYLRFLEVNGLDAAADVDFAAAAALECSETERDEFLRWYTADYAGTINSSSEFSVNPSTVIFPDSDEGDILEQRLFLSNQTETEIGVKIISTCSCLTVSERKLSLLPGSILPVTALLDTSGEEGELVRYLIFRPEGGGVPEQRISLRVKIR